MPRRYSGWRSNANGIHIHPMESGPRLSESTPGPLLLRTVFPGQGRQGPLCVHAHGMAFGVYTNYFCFKRESVTLGPCITVKTTLPASYYSQLLSLAYIHPDISIVKGC